MLLPGVRQAASRDFTLDRVICRGYLEIGLESDTQVSIDNISFNIKTRFSFPSKVFSFLTGLSSLLGPPGFWRLALPVRVCSLECNNDNNNNNDKLFHFYSKAYF